MDLTPKLGRKFDFDNFVIEDRKLNDDFIMPQIKLVRVTSAVVFQLHDINNNRNSSLHRFPFVMKYAESESDINFTLDIF